MSYIGNPKPKSGATNALESINNPNLTDSKGKTNTYLINATVLDAERTGNGVILTTGNFGQVRPNNNNFNLSVGDKVMVRVTVDHDGEVKTAHITEKLDNSLANRQNESEVRTSFVQYISSLFAVNKLMSPVFSAAFSYLAPDRNLLRYGNILVDNGISVQILDSQNNAERANIVSGSVISNHRNILSVNSPIGIININAKSNFQAGKKILFQIVDMPDEEQINSIKDFISTLVKDMSLNMNILKQVILAKKNIVDMEYYTKLLQLTASPHDNATLAKIFRQTRNIPASEIDKWIEKDIVAPFEATDKGSIVKVLGDKITQLYNIFKEMGILLPSIWREVKIDIPDTDEHALIKVKNEKDILEFNLSVNHQEFGAIQLKGVVKLGKKNRSPSDLSIIIEHTDKFPLQLIELLKSDFAEHITISNMAGMLDFVKYENVIGK